ncbi:HET-domain-containing protein, partial [Stipitochalara longipes BDJ]
MEILLIDAVEQRLTHCTTAVRFFALSYVWGKVSIPLTLLSNVEARCLENGLSENAIAFPQVIKDAISLVREIGERYLWVDALCIVQDDSTAKHQQIQRMDRIYSEAFATVVALAGDDANASLPGVRGGTRKPQEIHHVEGLSMVATPPPLKYILDISKWDTRAWTTQERMLSRRCIFFSKDHVYFQCGENVLCEESAGMRQVRLSARPRQTKSRDTHLRHPPWRFNFELYGHLVEMYTKRELSYIADIQNAFSGLSAVLANVFSTKLFYGLPAEALDLALLWTPVSTVHRRATLPENGAPTEDDFPSWSWMGW